MSTKKILLYVTQLEKGGAQAAALRLREEFHRRGLDSKVVFLYRKSNFSLLPEGATVLEQAPVTNPFQLLRLFWRLFRAIRQFQPDAIISFTHYANVIVAPIAFLSGVSARVASQRNPYSTYPLGAKYVDYLWGHLGIYTNITHVSSAVQASFKNHSKKYQRRGRVIPNGFLRLEAGDSHATRADFGIPDDSFFVLAVGRLATQKNHTTLLKALARVSDAFLVIAGDGPLRDVLLGEAKELGVNNRVKFTGELESTEIHSLFELAQCFAMPSLWEGMSNALIEALCHGKAIVASNIEENVEVLSDPTNGEAALWVEPKDVHGWVEALSTISDSADIRNELERRALVRAQAFDLTASANKYLKLLQC